MLYPILGISLIPNNVLLIETSATQIAHVTIHRPTSFCSVYNIIGYDTYWLSYIPQFGLYASSSYTISNRCTN